MESRLQTTALYLTRYTLLTLCNTCRILELKHTADRHEHLKGLLLMMAIPKSSLKQVQRNSLLFALFSYFERHVKGFDLLPCSLSPLLLSKQLTFFFFCSFITLVHYTIWHKRHKEPHQIKARDHKSCLTNHDPRFAVSLPFFRLA